MTPAEVLSQILTFLAGVVTGGFCVYGAGKYLAATDDEQEAPPVNTSPRRRSIPVIVSVLVVSFVMLAGFGIQQAIFQHQSADRDRCWQSWGAALVETVQRRSAAGAVRDSALDRIVATIIANRGNRTPQARAALNAALDAYQAATEARDDTRDDNPYPPLRCGSQD